MPLQNSARVSVHYKNGMVAGVEQNGISGFRANALEYQQFGAKLFRWLREHSIQ